MRKRSFDIRRFEIKKKLNDRYFFPEKFEKNFEQFLHCWLLQNRNEIQKLISNSKIVRFGKGLVS